MILQHILINPLITHACLLEYINYYNILTTDIETARF